jgi:hypothetical protein
MLPSFDRMQKTKDNAEKNYIFLAFHYKAALYSVQEVGSSFQILLLLLIIGLLLYHF